jgi:hypothetical protein
MPDHCNEHISSWRVPKFSYSCLLDIILNRNTVLPSKMTETLALQACIWEAPGWNLGWNISYLD